jgi:hypothetical protein
LWLVPTGVPGEGGDDRKIETVDGRTRRRESMSGPSVQVECHILSLDVYFPDTKTSGRFVAQWIRTDECGKIVVKAQEVRVCIV